MNTEATVNVSVKQLARVAECITTLDQPDVADETRNVLVDEAHYLVGQMLGPHREEVYESTSWERENGLNPEEPISEVSPRVFEKQKGFTLLELLSVLGIVSVVAVNGYIESGDAVITAAENVPTSSLQAAEKMGQCHDLCAEIIAHDKAVKAAWLAQLAAEQVQ